MLEFWKHFSGWLNYDQTLKAIRELSIVVPLTGFEICKAISPELKIGYGTLYRALDTLVDEGVLKRECVCKKFVYYQSAKEC